MQIMAESEQSRGIFRRMRSLIPFHFSSFTYLNVTQFLGALNDNIYKWLLIYLFIQIDGMEASARIAAVAGGIFVLPFLMFSSISGTLADRLSKRDIIVATKILELVIMASGVLAFVFESKLGGYGILFLMATQSAIFGPSKYGIIPEIVPSDRIPSANGLLTMFTFLAIIIGTFIPSILLDTTDRNFLIGALFCTLVSVVGLATSFMIEHTPPAGSTKKVNPRILDEVFKTLKLARTEPSLLTAVSASAYFMFCAAFFQMNMIPFAVEQLGLSDVQGGYLFLLTAMGIGLGAMLSGKISGKEVELGLVPLGGLGIMASCFLLDMSSSLWTVLPAVTLLGFAGGMWVTPLDSFIQVASPKEHRGQVIAATNFLCFFCVLLACGFLYLLSDVLEVRASRGFSVIGFVTLTLGGIIGYQFFDYVTRFVGMVCSRMRFQMTFSGRENIPESAAIYICSHTAWNDTLVLLGAQRRRMRFFIEQEQDHNKPWVKRLYRLLRVVMLPEIESLENNPRCLKLLRKALDNGISICIFVENQDVTAETQRLHGIMREILDQYPVLVLPVFIDKSEKEKQTRFFPKLYATFRCPTLVTFGTPHDPLSV